MRATTRGSSLRLERLEDRTLLSVVPGIESAVDAVAATPELKWKDYVLADEDGTLFGLDPNTLSPYVEPLYQGRRFTDIAYCPWEDAVSYDYYGLYGVWWSGVESTSYLYHVKIYMDDSGRVDVDRVREILTPAGERVYLNATEFSDRGTLYAAGYRLANDFDEIFTIDLTTAVATPHTPLPTGYFSAGDVTVHGSRITQRHGEQSRSVFSGFMSAISVQLMRRRRR